MPREDSSIRESAPSFAFFTPIPSEYAQRQGVIVRVDPDGYWVKKAFPESDNEVLVFLTHAGVVGVEPSPTPQGPGLDGLDGFDFCPDVVGI